jgi:hypothetical protein
MALNELGRLPRGWTRAEVLGIWGQAKFRHSEHPQFEEAGYTNPVRLATALSNYGTPAAVYVSSASIALAKNGYRMAQAARKKGGALPGPVRNLEGLYLLLSMIRSMSARAGVQFVQADGIRAILTQPTGGYAVVACLQNGGPAMHYVLVRKKLMGGSIEVYDSNWDELEWHGATSIPAALNDPVESLVTQGGRYKLQYTGLSVVLLG